MLPLSCAKSWVLPSLRFPTSIPPCLPCAWTKAMHATPRPESLPPANIAVASLTNQTLLRFKVSTHFRVCCISVCITPLLARQWRVCGRAFSVHVEHARVRMSRSHHHYLTFGRIHSVARNPKLCARRHSNKTPSELSSFLWMGGSVVTACAVCVSVSCTGGGCPYMKPVASDVASVQVSALRLCLQLNDPV